MAVSLAALCGFGTTACNALTGADDVFINPDFEADTDDDGSSSSTGGPTSGSGGTTSSTGSTGGPTGSGAGSTGSGASGSGSSGTGGDPGPTNCEYPTGPYGVDVGDTVPPTHSWEGFAPGASSPTTVSMSEFHDCDGSKGINALYFDTSQFG